MSGMTPAQSADFLAKLKTADGEKLIARDLSFEVLTGELFKRLNSLDFEESKRIAEHLGLSDKQVKQLPIPDWVKQNVTLYHSCLRKFLVNKSHANQHAAPVKKEMPAVAIKLDMSEVNLDQISSGQPPEESAGQHGDNPSPC
jgi:hypothetical protein